MAICRAMPTCREMSIFIGERARNQRHRRDILRPSATIKSEQLAAAAPAKCIYDDEAGEIHAYAYYGNAQAVAKRNHAEAAYSGAEAHRGTRQHARR